MLSILYEDDHYVAIDKPPSLLVHRTPIAPKEPYALQLLRDQIQTKVSPVHRLDRATCGVLLFAKHSEAARFACQAFEEGNVSKHYLALVRGYLEPKGVIDHPLSSPKWPEPKAAITSFLRHGTAEWNHPVGRYATARYSLVSLYPKTGRRHQLRRHMSHLRHPIIGDTSHGDRFHNKAFRENFTHHGLFLQAISIEIPCGFSKKKIIIKSPRAPMFQEILSCFPWHFDTEDALPV